MAQGSGCNTLYSTPKESQCGLIEENLNDTRFPNMMYYIYFRSIPLVVLAPQYGINRALTYLQESFVVPITGWGTDPIYTPELWGTGHPGCFPDFMKTIIFKV